MNPPPLPYITALYAGLIALLLLLLAARISRLRRQFEIGINDGGNKTLALAIRAHGNTVEWALPYLLLLLIAELNRAAPLLIHFFGLVLIVGRVLHALGLSASSGASFGRFVGTGLTWLGLSLLAVYALWLFVRVALV